MDTGAMSAERAHDQTGSSPLARHDGWQRTIGSPARGEPAVVETLVVVPERESLFVDRIVEVRAPWIRRRVPDPSPG